MFYKDKNVLVTGGTGFTGINLIKKLVELGAHVTATLHNNMPVVLDEDVRYIPGDLTDKDCCNKVCEGQDYVFMTAANTSGAAVMENTPLAHVTPNVIMNTLMLEAAHKANVKKFLFMSSTTVYPISDDKSLKEDDVNDEFFEKYYCVGWMKRFSEVMCEMYSTKIKKPMTTIVVRPGNLYGEHDDFEWDTSHSTAAIIRRVVERHSPLVVWGDGGDVKDLIYISDLIDGMVDAMEKLDEFTIINMASGESHTIKETLEIILEVDDYTDADVQYDLKKPVMIKKRLIDISKAKKLLGYEPKVDLRTGLEKTVKWYRSNRISE